MMLGLLDIHVKKKMNFDSCIIPYANINMKWVMKFNVNGKTRKLLRENIREYLQALGGRQGFLTQSVKDKKLDFIVTQFYSSKEFIWRVKRQA